jgi:spermidine synthase
VNRTYTKPHIDVFPDLCKIYPKKKAIGSATVQHFTVTRDGALKWLMSFRERVWEGDYVQLVLKGEGTVMSDTHMERWSCIKFPDAASGRVLTFGLGLGMTLFPILKKKEVSAVTVVEKNPDVIKLIEPFVRHPKLNIVEGDALTWKPPSGEKYEAMWFDIWGDRKTDNLVQMTELHRRYRKHLVPHGWMDSWYRDELRRMRRQERKGGW